MGPTSTLCDLHPSSPMLDFTLRYWLLGGGLFCGQDNHGDKDSCVD